MILLCFLKKIQWEYKIILTPKMRQRPIDEFYKPANILEREDLNFENKAFEEQAFYCESSDHETPSDWKESKHENGPTEHLIVQRPHVHSELNNSNHTFIKLNGNSKGIKRAKVDKKGKSKVRVQLGRERSAKVIDLCE